MSADQLIVTDLAVEGMTCDHCATAVRGEVGLLAGVSDVAVDVAAGRVRIISSSPLDPADVRDAVDEAGYTVVEA